MSESITESWVTAENGKILVMQVNWYTSGNAVLQHRAYGVNLMLLMLSDFCWSQLGSWAGRSTSVPCFSLSFFVLGSFGSSSTLQHIRREPGWVWCFPQGHITLDLSVHCSNIQMALYRDGLILSDSTNLDGAWNCICSKPPTKAVCYWNGSPWDQLRCICILTQFSECECVISVLGCKIYLFSPCNFIFLMSFCCVLVMGVRVTSFYCNVSAKYLFCLSGDFFFSSVLGQQA